MKNLFLSISDILKLMMSKSINRTKWRLSLLSKIVQSKIRYLLREVRCTRHALLSKTNTTESWKTSICNPTPKRHQFGFTAHGVCCTSLAWIYGSVPWETASEHIGVGLLVVVRLQYTSWKGMGVTAQDQIPRTLEMYSRCWSASRQERRRNGEHEQDRQLPPRMASRRQGFNLSLSGVTNCWNS